MTVLLDENVPRKLKWRLVERGLEVVTVPERGRSGVGKVNFCPEQRESSMRC